MATFIEGDPRALLSIATTPRCKGGWNSIPWIITLYPRSLTYNAECLARWHQVSFFESLVWLDLGLNPCLPDHWRTLYSLGRYSTNTIGKSIILTTISLVMGKIVGQTGLFSLGMAIGQENRKLKSNQLKSVSKFTLCHILIAQRCRYIYIYIYTWVNQKFCNILLSDSLCYLYHLTEAVKTMEDNRCGWLYRANWCADTLCTASLCVWFESRTDERTKKSNLGTSVLWVRSKP